MGRLFEEDVVIVFFGDDHLAGELGQVLFDRIRDVDFAFIDQDHHRRRGNRLGLRGNPEHRIGWHWLFRGDIGIADGFGGEDLILVGDEHHRAGEFLFFDDGLNRGGEFGWLVGNRELADSQQAQSERCAYRFWTHKPPERMQFELRMARVPRDVLSKHDVHSRLPSFSHRFEIRDDLGTVTNGDEQLFVT
jgi:hypothetical protein